MVDHQDVTANIKHYDGTNWTSGGSTNTARSYLAGFGTQTAALFAVVQHLVVDNASLHLNYIMDLLGQKLQI